MGKKQKTDQLNGSAFAPEDNGISYGGFLQVANKIVDPEIFLNMTGNEFKVVYYLMFLQWKFPKANGHFTLAYIYLQRATGLSEGTLKRLMKSLSAKGYLICTKVNRDWRTSKGNDYLTYSGFLWDKSTSQTDQFDLSMNAMTDQNDLSDRSKRSVIGSDLGTSTDQIDLQDHINTFLIGDAQRHVHSNASPGTDEGQIERCPNGQDQGNENKGVPFGDNIQKPLIGVAALDAELKRRTQNEEKAGW